MEQFICQYCQKVCKNANSQRQHEIRCPNNPNRKDWQRFVGYESTHHKGHTKHDDEIVNKWATTLKQRYDSGEIVPYTKGKPGTFTGHTHTEETKQKISEGTSKGRKLGYANGTITPAPGIGRGKYSYFTYNGTEYMLRSTYEFVVAMYLASQHIPFEVEKIHVPAAYENPYGETFISDFSIGTRVIEVKGIPSTKDQVIKDSFEKAGYSFKELFKDDVVKLKEQLESHNIPMHDLLVKVRVGHNSREYFHYNFDTDFNYE